MNLKTLASSIVVATVAATATLPSFADPSVDQILVHQL